MKHAFLFVLALATPGLAEDAAPLATWRADNGPLPPDYAWATSVTLFADGHLTLTHCTGYATEPPGCTTVESQASAEAIAAILAAATDSGLIEAPARLNPDPPIGGGGTSGSVTLPAGTLDLPRDPLPADADRVAQVLAAIAAAIPADLVPHTED